MTRQQIPPWVIQEAEKKSRRKPGPKLKPVEPKPKLHVKVNLTGSVEFDLEGDNAVELAGLLKGLRLDEVIEFVDPWASGAELRYDVEVTDAVSSSWWEANETTGTIEIRQPDIRPRWEWHIQ